MDANDLVKAIEDDISEELASNDLSVSDLSKVTQPNFEGVKASKQNLAFAPTIPIQYAFKTGKTLKSN